jgi:hypothetical protein
VQVAAIAGAVVSAAVAASAVALLLDRDGAGDPGSGPGSGSGSGSSGTSGVFTTTGPWRVVIRDERQGDDSGCDLTTTNAAGDGRSITEVYGTKSFQVPGKGRFRWTSNDPGCVVVQRSGPGNATLPFVQPVSTGDTDAFRPQGRVLVTVTDFSGSPSCDLRLVSVDGGRPVDLATVAPKEPTVVLDPNGLAPVYLAEPECSVRVSGAA